MRRENTRVKRSKSHHSKAKPINNTGHQTAGWRDWRDKFRKWREKFSGRPWM